MRGNVEKRAANIQLMSSFREILETEYPIIQAPMAGVQGSALAIAVSNAGGLGSLPCAMLSAEALRSELAAIRAGRDGPYNVNFFCHTPPEPDDAREGAWRRLLAKYYEEFGIRSPEKGSGGSGRAPFTEEAADVLEEFRPPVVSFHFGLPSESLMRRVKAMGSKIFASATTVEEARWLERRGLDAIVAQGWEAGGHRGMFLTEDLTTQAGTFALVPQVVRAVKVPVIAAGGIADASGVAAAMALGAVAAHIGTAYLLCPEATTRPVHREALRSETGRHTAVTNLFSGRPARGIVNRIMKELGPVNEMVPAFPLAAAALAPLREKAESTGDSGFSALWSGQNATGCRDIPAAEITRKLGG
jgi:nitronate monooxygenase